LFPFIKVLDDETVVWKSDVDSKTTNERLEEFLILLSVLSRNENNERVIKEKFPVLFANKDKDFNQQIDFTIVFPQLLDALGEDNVLCGIFKCINQGVIASPVIVLHKIFFSAKMKYVDMRGNWEVIVQFKENSIDIIHKRWERSLPELFTFCWEFKIKLYNAEPVKILETDLHISQIEMVSKQPGGPSKDDIINILRDIYKP